MASVGSVITGPPVPNPPLIFIQFLSLDNDGSSFNANVDGSGTPKNFDYSCATETHQITRIIINIQDAGVWNTSKYGAIATLANGINLQVLDDTDTIVMNLEDGIAITQTSDWQKYSYDGQLVQFPGGDDYFVCRWTFAKAGHNIRLKPGYTIRVVINDDLTGLTGHYFCVEGFTEDTSY